MFDDFFSRDLSRWTVRGLVLSTGGKPRDDKAQKPTVKAAPSPNPATKINKFRRFHRLPAEIHILV